MTTGVALSMLIEIEESLCRCVVREAVFEVVVEVGLVDVLAAFATLASAAAYPNIEGTTTARIQATSRRSRRCIRADWMP